jgi:hypothetical protein
MRTTRTLAAALAIAALAVPAAQAKPATDMHASVAQAAAEAQAKQDLRSPDARDAATQAQIKQDLRSADSRDAALHPRGPGQAVNAPGATTVDSASVAAPANPRAIAPAPVAKVDDGGIEWLMIGLGIAGSLLVVSGLAALNSRRLHRPRVTA